MIMKYILRFILISALVLVFQPVVSQEIKTYSSFDKFAPLLDKKNDTTYVINFWATWCRPCVKELPYFQKLNDEYRGKKVEVILVSLDFGERVDERVKNFLEKRDFSMRTVILDDANSNSWIDKVDTSWTGAIPATLIYNAQRRNFYEQSFSYDELKKALTKIL